MDVSKQDKPIIAGFYDDWSGLFINYDDIKNYAPIYVKIRIEHDREYKDCFFERFYFEINSLYEINQEKVDEYVLDFCETSLKTVYDTDITVGRGLDKESGERPCEYYLFAYDSADDKSTIYMIFDGYDEDQAVEVWKK